MIISMNVYNLICLQNRRLLILAKIIRLLLPFFHNKFLEAGVDEAGRGCFAGPVFAAAVILPVHFYHPLLNDSKQLTAEQRMELRPLIEATSIAWAVADVNNDEIDRINILQASYKAMHKAIRRLTATPELLLIDGNRFKTYKNIPHHCVIKGDAIYASIAAASVLAKTHRDEYMQRLHRRHRVYCWDSNKGYGTREHRQAIREHGLCRYHRKSFNLTCLVEQDAELILEDTITNHVALAT